MFVSVDGFPQPTIAIALPLVLRAGLLLYARQPKRKEGI